MSWRSNEPNRHIHIYKPYPLCFLLKSLSGLVVQPALASKKIKTHLSSIWGSLGWPSVKCWYLLQSHIKLETWISQDWYIWPHCLQGASPPSFQGGKDFTVDTLSVSLEHFEDAVHPSRMAGWVLQIPNPTFQVVWICYWWASRRKSELMDNFPEPLSSMQSWAFSLSWRSCCHRPLALRMVEFGFLTWLKPLWSQFCGPVTVPTMTLAVDMYFALAMHETGSVPRAFIYFHL